MPSRPRLVLLTLVLSLAWPVAAPAREPGAAPRPAFHDELGRALDDVGRHVHGWSTRLRDTFGPHGPLGHGPALTPTGERALISFMLAHRDELGLSAQQVQALDALRADFQREAIRREADLRIAEMDLTALRRPGVVDMARVEAKIREIERLRADLRLAQVRTIEQGRGQLSPDQRERLETLLGDPRPPRPRGVGRAPERL
jgi:Spy/CpxP family protein refolding chaperone